MKPDEIFLWENCNVAAWFLGGALPVRPLDGRATFPFG